MILCVFDTSKKKEYLELLVKQGNAHGSLKEIFSKRIFITGHTGFKGSWLTSILLHFGSKVTGFSMKDEKNVLMKNSLIIKKLIIFMRHTRHQSSKKNK